MRMIIIGSNGNNRLIIYDPTNTLLEAKRFNTWFIVQ